MAARAKAPVAPAPPLAAEICLELQDNSTLSTSAIDFFQLKGHRDPAALAGVLAEQFAEQNRSLLDTLDVGIRTVYNGRDVSLTLESGNAVGAIPLIAPLSARPDFGLVVQPRFPWAGIGPMLAGMGWRVSPSPLPLPLLRRSERRVPPWVLSSMILTRMQTLLDNLERRFELVQEVRSAPRGQVDWTRYATNALPRAALMSVPCQYPDLRDDRLLKGSIRFVVEKQRQSLETQRSHGSHVLGLLDLAGRLAERLRLVPAAKPTPGMMETWQRRPLRVTSFLEGLQAMAWTVDERGLAGTSDLEGIPWMLPMDLFFEAWVETICAVVARRAGYQMRVGRIAQTTQRLHWHPGHLHAQRSLQPDLILERADLTVIVDAKYKRHWDDLQRSTLADATREAHRHDLLQVLAYANLSRTTRTIACLIYPCALGDWETLRATGRLWQRSEVTSGHRTVEIWLTAAPMTGEVERVAGPIADRLRRMAGP